MTFRIACLLAFIAFPALVRGADEPAVDAARSQPPASWDERLDRATALQAEGDALKATAGATRDRAYGECATRFLVNDCRNAAYRDYLSTLQEVRRLESEGRAIERAVKLEQRAARDAERTDEDARRQAELPDRAAETASSRQATSDREATIRADKEKRAAEGEKRKAADAERLARKQAQQAEKLAAKKREAEQQAAEKAARH